MKTPARNDAPLLWELDGSLTDIYVFDTSIDDWNHLLELARRGLIEYTYDGVAQLLPTAEELFEDRDGVHLLSIDVHGVAINCHFFIVEEIELDVDPRQVTNEHKHEAVLKFVEALSRKLGKGARLTPENSSDCPILTYDQAQGWLVHVL